MNKMFIAALAGAAILCQTSYGMYPGTHNSNLTNPIVTVVAETDLDYLRTRQQQTGASVYLGTFFTQGGTHSDQTGTRYNVEYARHYSNGHYFDYPTGNYTQAQPTDPQNYEPENQKSPLGTRIHQYIQRDIWEEHAGTIVCTGGIICAVAIVTYAVKKYLSRNVDKERNEAANTDMHPESLLPIEYLNS